MSNIKLITVTNQPERADVLVKSAKKHNWDISVLEVEWRGFGTKLIATYEYLKAHPEVERFVFADAHDVVVMGGEKEFEEKLGTSVALLSAERGLWPPYLNVLINEYSKYSHYNGFYYPNSGLYFCKRDDFMSLFEKYPVDYSTDDQYWWNLVYLNEWHHEQLGDLAVNLDIDNTQSIFNSHSFIAEGEYTYNNGRVQIMGNEPVFVHSNGGTKDEKLDELIKNMLA